MGSQCSEGEALGTVAVLNMFCFSPSPPLWRRLFKSGPPVLGHSTNIWICPKTKVDWSHKHVSNSQGSINETTQIKLNSYKYIHINIYFLFAFASVKEYIEQQEAATGQPSAHDGHLSIVPTVLDEQNWYSNRRGIIRPTAADFAAEEAMAPRTVQQDLDPSLSTTLQRYWARRGFHY